MTDKIVKLAEDLVLLVTFALAGACAAAVLAVVPDVVARAPGSPWIFAACGGFLALTVGFHVASVLLRRTGRT